MQAEVDYMNSFKRSGVKADGTFHVTSNSESITIDTGLGSELKEFCLFGMSPKLNAAFTGVHFSTFAYWNSEQAGYYDSATTLGTTVAGGQNRALNSIDDTRAAKIVSVVDGVVTINAAAQDYMIGNDFHWVAY